MNVYQCINAVTADLAVEGIAKNRNNAQQGYKFRGIDDMYNAIAPLLAKHGLCILPRYSNRTSEERQTAKGGTLFYVNVVGEFTFASAEDGTCHVVTMFGEAMDSGDKATNKAMSAAFKYAVMQTFAIPTEGDNDADAVTHVVAGPSEEAKAKAADFTTAIAACTNAAQLGDLAVQMNAANLPGVLLVDLRQAFKFRKEALAAAP